MAEEREGEKQRILHFQVGEKGRFVGWLVGGAQLVSDPTFAAATASSLPPAPRRGRGRWRRGECGCINLFLPSADGGEGRGGGGGAGSPVFKGMEEEEGEGRRNNGTAGERGETTTGKQAGECSHSRGGVMGKGRGLFCSLFLRPRFGKLHSESGKGRKGPLRAPRPRAMKIVRGGNGGDLCRRLLLLLLPAPSLLPSLTEPEKSGGPSPPPSS